MNAAQMNDFILQALHHERGGVLIYRKALECVVTDELREEWEEYLQQTEGHVVALEKVCEALGLDPNEITPGCRVVRHLGTALVQAMDLALMSGDDDQAELVAGDCIVLAETKDHANWQILGKCAKELSGDAASVLQQAYEKIEDQEDEHLYHSRGWTRELWLKSLGLAYILPPPEEQKDVKSAVAAAKAQKESEAQRRH